MKITRASYKSLTLNVSLPHIAPVLLPGFFHVLGARQFHERDPVRPSVLTAGYVDAPVGPQDVAAWMRKRLQSKF